MRPGEGRWETQQEQIRDNETREGKLNTRHVRQETIKLKQEVTNKRTPDVEKGRRRETPLIKINNHCKTKNAKVTKTELQDIQYRR